MAFVVEGFVAFDFVASFAGWADGGLGWHLRSGIVSSNRSFASYCHLDQHFQHSLVFAVDWHSPFLVGSVVVIAAAVAVLKKVFR